MNRPTILPPNASKLLRAIDQATPQWDHLPPALAGGLYGHPDSLAPWLAAEWGISQFARYFNGNTGQLITAGVPWLLQRGTPAAVRTALGWLGFGAVSIEEEGPRLQINPGRNVTAEEVRAIAHVVRASIPAHVTFYRVHHGLDIRAFKWGRSKWGRAVYGNESGVPIDVNPWGDDLIVSQMPVYKWPAPALAPGAGQSMRRVCFMHPTRRASEWRWGHARYGHNTGARLHAHGLRHIRSALLGAAFNPASGLHELRHLFAHPQPAPALRLPAQPAAHIVHATLAKTFTRSNGWTGAWDSRTWRDTPPYQMTLEP